MCQRATLCSAVTLTAHAVQLKHLCMPCSLAQPANQLDVNGITLSPISMGLIMDEQSHPEIPLACSLPSKPAQPGQAAGGEQRDPVPAPEHQQHRLGLCVMEPPAQPAHVRLHGAPLRAQHCPVHRSGEPGQQGCLLCKLELMLWLQEAVTAETVPMMFCSSVAMCLSAVASLAVTSQRSVMYGAMLQASSLTSLRQGPSTILNINHGSSCADHASLSGSHGSHPCRQQEGCMIAKQRAWISTLITHTIIRPPSAAQHSRMHKQL